MILVRLALRRCLIMENREVKMVNMYMMILSLALQKDCISQSQINVLTKEIMTKHRDGTINVMYRNLVKEFYDTVKVVGPDRFINLVHDEILKINRVDSIITLRNECPLIAYALITEVKMIARVDFCQSINNRICNAYVAAVQSLDA